MKIMYYTFIGQGTAGVREAPKSTKKNTLVWEPSYVIKFDDLVISLIK